MCSESTTWGKTIFFFVDHDWKSETLLGVFRGIASDVFWLWVGFVCSFVHGPCQCNKPKETKLSHFQSFWNSNLIYVMAWALSYLLAASSWRGSSLMRNCNRHSQVLDIDHLTYPLAFTEIYIILIVIVQLLYSDLHKLLSLFIVSRINLNQVVSIQL